MHSLLGPRLRMLHWYVDHAITQELAQMELTSAQGQIIGFLSRSKQAPCPKDIEDAFRLTHPTVSGLLRRLEKKGFIQILPDEQDRRCKRIHLLAKGQECNCRIRSVIEQTEAKLVRDFLPQQKEELICLLDMAIKNMGDGCCCRSPQEEKEHD